MYERIALAPDLIARLLECPEGEVDQDLLDEIGLQIGDVCQDFEPMLSVYRHDERGTIDGCDIKVADGGVELCPDLSGAVWLDFEESAHYGCRDMDRQYDHNVRIAFRIDLEDSALILEFKDDEPRRDTVEEF